MSFSSFLPLHFCSYSISLCPFFLFPCSLSISLLPPFLSFHFVLIPSSSYLIPFFLSIFVLVPLFPFISVFLRISFYLPPYLLVYSYCFFLSAFLHITSFIFYSLTGILMTGVLSFPLATEDGWRWLFAVTPALCVLQLAVSPFLLESPRSIEQS